MNPPLIARQLHETGFATFRSGWSTTLRIPLLNAAQRQTEGARDTNYRYSQQAANDRKLTLAYEMWCAKVCFAIAVDAPTTPNELGMTIERSGMIFRKHEGAPTARPMPAELLTYREQQQHPDAYQRFHVNPYSYSLYVHSTPGSVVIRKFDVESERDPIIFWPESDEHLILTGKDYHATHFGFWSSGYGETTALHAGFPMEGERLELTYRETPVIETVIREREIRDAPRAAAALEAIRARSLERHMALIDSMYASGSE